MIVYEKTDLIIWDALYLLKRLLDQDQLTLLTFPTSHTERGGRFCNMFF